MHYIVTQEIQVRNYGRTLANKEGQQLGPFARLQVDTMVKSSEVGQKMVNRKKSMGSRGVSENV